MLSEIVKRRRDTSFRAPGTIFLLYQLEVLQRYVYIYIAGSVYLHEWCNFTPRTLWGREREREIFLSVFFICFSAAVATRKVGRAAKQQKRNTASKEGWRWPNAMALFFSLFLHRFHIGQEYVRFCSDGRCDSIIIIVRYLFIGLGSC